MTPQQEEEMTRDLKEIAEAERKLFLTKLKFVCTKCYVAGLNQLDIMQFNEEMDKLILGLDLCKI